MHLSLCLMSSLSRPFKNCKDNLAEICVFETPRNVSPGQWNLEPIMVSSMPPENTATRVAWGPFNDFLLVAYTSGSVAQVDPVSGMVLQVEQVGVPVSVMIWLNSILVVA